MNAMTLFQHEEFGEVRIVDQEGRPWFVGKDVATALGYSNPRDALARHCKGVAKHDTFKDGGHPQSIIPESDVYRLVMRSQLPDAERFQDWVCEEVLPAIRRTGGYVGRAPGGQGLDVAMDRLNGVLNRVAEGISDLADRVTALERGAEGAETNVVEFAPPGAALPPQIPYSALPAAAVFVYRDPMTEDLGKLIEEVVGHARGREMAIIPCRDLLEVAWSMGLLRHRFPPPEEKGYDYLADRSIQSQWGKFLAKEAVGKVFEINGSQWLVKRMKQRDCSALAIIRLRAA